MPYCELNYAVNRHPQSSLHLTSRHDRRPWWSGRSLSHVAYNTIPNCNTAGWSTYVVRLVIGYVHRQRSGAANICYTVYI